MTKKSIHLSIAAFVFCILGVSFTHDSSALTYSSNVDVGFTFNPTISVNLSGDLLINNLAPGSVSDSNTINVTVATNASQGYVLTATSGTKTTNTDLVNQSNSAYKFSSIATNASLASLTTDNTWGFSYSSDSGSTWSNYSGLPLDNDDEGATGKQLLSTINPSDNRTIQFKIGAKAATDQAAGTYLNTINFYAVANPDPTLQPVSCPAGKICYNPNSLTTVVGEMGQQIPDSSELANGIQLWAPNFKNDGYGFAGWADSTTYNGMKYGPNETITAPSDISTNGLSLYAIWIRSAGDLQNWTGCSSMSQGEITALKDVRDNDVYAVAKLTDGKCWMIENLRLDNVPELTSANTHNPSLPLTNTWNYASSHITPTTSNYLSSTTDPIQTGWCSAFDSDCLDQSMLATNNTTLFTNNTASNYSASSNVYSYGNYYNWYSATAGHGRYYTGQTNVTGDICPAGWYLPTGGQTTTNTTADFYILGKALMDNQEPNQNTSDGYGYYDSTLTNNIGDTADKAFRKYPNNFVYSGGVPSTDISGRNYNGSYWSASGYEDPYPLIQFDYAHNTTLYDSEVFSGTTWTYKGYGMSARCIAGV